MNKTAMFRLSYGLFVLTAAENGKKNGCITNTAIQAASNPLLITFCVNKANFTHDMILHTKKACISVLSEDASFDTFQHFGFQSGRDVDKFADYTSYKDDVNGLPIITAGTNAYFSLNVVNTVDLGSHTMFVATVEDMDVLSETPSATYTYYQNHIKPKPDAPKAAGKTVWRCRICGYIYEGDPIPDDFICPICKHPASDFEKITT